RDRPRPEDARAARRGAAQAPRGGRPEGGRLRRLTFTAKRKGHQMPAKIYYDQDADLGLLKGRKIAIIGYGSQGHAHALNLKDSGQDVVVGLYKGSKSWAKAEKDGLRVATVNEAAQMAAVIMILLPDQSQRQVFESEIKAAFETLVEAGYQPEVAYFECMHEMKLIVDLFYQGGLAYMRYSVSDTAEYGDYTRGPRIVSAETKAEMKKILAEIQSGQFAREWVLENQANRAGFLAMRRRDAEHPIEDVGKRLRA